MALRTQWHVRDRDDGAREDDLHVLLRGPVPHKPFSRTCVGYSESRQQLLDSYRRTEKPTNVVEHNDTTAVFRDQVEKSNWGQVSVGVLVGSVELFELRSNHVRLRCPGPPVQVQAQVFASDDPSDTVVDGCL
jgi:hypothetical protein